MSDTKHTLAFHHIKSSPKRSKRLFCALSLSPPPPPFVVRGPPDSHLLQMLDACGHGKTCIMTSIVFIGLVQALLSPLGLFVSCAGVCAETGFSFPKLSAFVFPTIFFFPFCTFFFFFF